MRIFVAAAVTITSAIGLGTINRRIWLISRPAGPGKQPNATKTIAAVKFFARSVALVGSIAGGLALVA
jgi:hypothetical protein